MLFRNLMFNVHKSYLTTTDVSESEAYGQANPERNSTWELVLGSLSLQGDNIQSRLLCVHQKGGLWFRRFEYMLTEVIFRQVLHRSGEQRTTFDGAFIWISSSIPFCCCFCCCSFPKPLVNSTPDACSTYWSHGERTRECPAAHPLPASPLLSSWDPCPEWAGFHPYCLIPICSASQMVALWVLP